MAQGGVMSYAVSLQMQCYMFIVGHLDELPFDVIALLPIGIRRKLLLMLPALDICKLEETPVTDGISMGYEIWKLKCDRHKFKYKDMMTLTWKDFYLVWAQAQTHRGWLLRDLLVLPYVHVEYKCTGNIQGLHFAKSGRAIVPDRYKTHDNLELLKLIVDSNISFKVIELGTFMENFFGSDIPVECIPLVEKLFNSVIELFVIGNMYCTFLCTWCTCSCS